MHGSKQRASLSYKCQFHNLPGTYKKPDTQFEKESREQSKQHR